MWGKLRYVNNVTGVSHHADCCAFGGIACKQGFTQEILCSICMFTTDKLILKIIYIQSFLPWKQNSGKSEDRKRLLGNANKDILLYMLQRKLKPENMIIKYSMLTEKQMSGNEKTINIIRFIFRGCYPTLLCTTEHCLSIMWLFKFLIEKPSDSKLRLQGKS
jgi:hypothetical protein